MADASDEVFRRHQKVVAAVDMVGIPAGTRGKVMYVAGFTWPRCRVRFDNGAERSSLDHRHLQPVEVWEAAETEAARQRLRDEHQRVTAELRAKVIAQQSAHGAASSGAAS
jgi:uncharacterized small protein (DUF1192 family)